MQGPPRRLQALAERRCRVRWAARFPGSKLGRSQDRGKIGAARGSPRSSGPGGDVGRRGRSQSAPERSESALERFYPHPRPARPAPSPGPPVLQLASGKRVLRETGPGPQGLPPGPVPSSWVFFRRPQGPPRAPGTESGEKPPGPLSTRPPRQKLDRNPQSVRRLWGGPRKSPEDSGGGRKLQKKPPKKTPLGHTRPEEDRPPACPQGCHPRPAGRGRTVWHRGDNSEEGAREGEGRWAGEGNGEQEYGGFVKCRLARWFLTPRGSLNLERSAAFRSPDRSTSGDSGPLAAFNLERPRRGRRASTRCEPSVGRGSGPPGTAY